MVEVTTGPSIDPGLAADVLAAIADGNAQRDAVSARMPDLREVVGMGALLSATRVRSAILDCALGAAETLDSLGCAWAAQSVITESAWQALAADPRRWQGEFVAERIEGPVPTRSRREMGSTPPSRFHSFSHPEVGLTPRTFRISGESVASSTFDDISRGLAGVEPAAVLEYAARWSHVASVLNSSVDSVDDLTRERGGCDAASAATGIHRLVDTTRRVAGSWSTIGNAVRCFGVGMRHAEQSVAALRDGCIEAMAACEVHPGFIEQQPVSWEQFERRARAEFDETYCAGLFALVAGLALAGESRPSVRLDSDQREPAR